MDDLSPDEYRARKQAAQRRKRNRYMREDYRKRKKFITCVLEPEQYRAFKRHAGKLGIKLTAFLREASLAYIRRHRLVPREIADQLPSLIALLRNIANNINQITRRTNTFKQVTFYDLTKARRNVRNLEATILNFIQGVR